MKGWLYSKKIKHSILFAILCVIAIELVIRMTDLDIYSLYKSFYVVEGDYIYDNKKELYRDSKNTELLYELIPNAKAVYQYHYSCYKIENLNFIKPCRFNINRFGMRDIPGKIRHKDKIPGVFRIIVLGGSNTFGVSASDEETYPARLEKLLNQKHPGKFEVWNAGLSAYVLSQIIEYAQIIIKEYDPDLLVIQNFNLGRRAFFYKGDLRYFFHLNKELYQENIPLVMTESNSTQAIHAWLVTKSRTYALGVSLLNNIIYINPKDTWQEKACSKFSQAANTQGDKISLQKFTTFIKNNSTPVLFFNSSENSILTIPKKTPHLNLNFKSKPREYSEIHPPAYVYEWYAQVLMENLQNLKYIK